MRLSTSACRRLWQVTADDDNDGESSGAVGKGELVGAYCVLSVMGFFM